jgi:hypothetical protein
MGSMAVLTAKVCLAFGAGSEQPTTETHLHCALKNTVLVEPRQATFGHVVLWQDGGVI